MSTEFFNDQWRIPSNENQNKVSNYSMDFDGSSDFINCGNLTDLNNLTAFSTSSWINYSGTPVTSHIFLSGGTSLSNRFYVQLLSSTQIRYGSGSAFDNVSISTISSGSWHHIVTVHNGTSLDVYLDGIKQNSSPVTVVAPNANIGDDFTIGRYNISPSYYWDGKIDQVSVFDYALSATQVSTLYGGGTAVTSPMSLSPKPIYYAQLGDQSVYNGANYLVPNNSLSSYAFEFANDIIIIANGSTIARQQNISYSVWVKSTSLSATRYIVGNNTSSNKGTSVFLLNDVLVFQIGNNSNNSYFGSRVSSLSNYVNANEWFHVAASWDGTDSKIYINGVERNSWTPSQPYTISGWNNNFIIGRRADSTSSGFYGELSNVAFWDSGLTPTQVQTIYNNGTPNDISLLNPVGWWKLNQQDVFVSPNWTITDYGSGGNDGTSSGMTSSNLVVSDLQQTSGYSPYALDFDGVNDYLDTPQIDLGSTNTISFWINTTTTTQGAIFGDPNGYADYALFSQPTLNRTAFRLGNNDSGYYQIEVSSGLLNDGNWHHHCLTRDGVTINYYIDGILQTNVINNTLNASAGTNTTIENIFAMPNGTYEYGGKLSNVALWNIELTSTEVTEIYNEGHPSDLNNFSGTSPVSWWQLGSNSSYNSGAWTCLDEIGTNNAVSVNMTNDDIVDGVGYSASGLGSSSIDIKGDAPYSTANGLSENMDVLDRTTDVPS